MGCNVALKAFLKAKHLHSGQDTAWQACIKN